ncbi:hypothetical protein, partial [Bacillus tropicus]|uniref:hypothetical protein n=1 Tax=Bacillus tropicus TaxID=2026188 RepID=UPI00285266CD
PYLFNVVATAFASTSADSTMPIVFKNLFDFILFIMRIALLYVLIIGNMIAGNSRIRLRQTYTLVRKKDIRVIMSCRSY